MIKIQTVRAAFVVVGRAPIGRCLTTMVVVNLLCLEVNQAKVENADCIEVPRG
jgi:hypothetical protein